MQGPQGSQLCALENTLGPEQGSTLFFSARTDTSQERPGKNILKQSKQRAPGTAFLSHFFISVLLLNPLECLPSQHFSRETLNPQGYRKSKNDTR